VWEELQVHCELDGLGEQFLYAFFSQQARKLHRAGSVAGQALLVADLATKVLPARCLPPALNQCFAAEVDFLFPSRLHDSPHLGTRQYARILGHWVDELGLDRSEYGTHSMRRTKATLIYRRTKNLRAVQLLLGHAKLESTVRYLGIEVDDALEISEQTEI
jgi:integrase